MPVQFWSERAYQATKARDSVHTGYSPDGTKPVRSTSALKTVLAKTVRQIQGTQAILQVVAANRPGQAYILAMP